MGETEHPQVQPACLLRDFHSMATGFSCIRCEEVTYHIHASSPVQNAGQVQCSQMVLIAHVSKNGQGMVLYTLSSPGRPVHSDTVLGFSWKHSSHAAIAQRLFTHIATTVYSQVLIYTAESTEAS